MPKYTDSPFYLTLKPLMDQANALVNACKAKTCTTFDAKSTLATVQYFQQLLELIDEIAQQFDGNSTIGLINTAKLALAQYKLKTLNSQENMQKSHGTVAHHVLQEIQNKAMDNSSFSKQRMVEYFPVRKAKSLERVSASIGTDPSAATIYDALTASITARWPDDAVWKSMGDKEQKATLVKLFKWLDQELFSNSYLPHHKKPYHRLQFSLKDPESVSLVINIKTAFQKATADTLVRYLPFFNPKALEIQDNNRSVWSKLLALVEPSLKTATVTCTDEANYCYCLTNVTETTHYNLVKEYKNTREQQIEFCDDLLVQEGVISRPAAVPVVSFVSPVVVASVPGTFFARGSGSVSGPAPAIQPRITLKPGEVEV